jgi:hypothetical protein
MLHHAGFPGASKPRNVNVPACFRCYDPPKSPTRFTEDPQKETAGVLVVGQQLQPYQVPDDALHTRLCLSDPFRLDRNRYLRVRIAHDKINLWPASGASRQWSEDGMSVFRASPIVALSAQNLSDRLGQVFLTEQFHPSAGSFELQPATHSLRQNFRIIDHAIPRLLALRHNSISRESLPACGNAELDCYLSADYHRTVFFVFGSRTLLPRSRQNGMSVGVFSVLLSHAPIAAT